MTARIMAPISAGLEPDKPELVEMCLSLQPVSPGVLRTAAAWFFESGMYPEALEMAERAIVVSRDPDPMMLELALTSAGVLGDTARIAAHASYLSVLFPETYRLIPVSADTTGN